MVPNASERDQTNHCLDSQGLGKIKGKQMIVKIQDKEIEVADIREVIHHEGWPLGTLIICMTGNYRFHFPMGHDDIIKVKGEIERLRTVTEKQKESPFDLEFAVHGSQTVYAQIETAQCTVRIQKSSDKTPRIWIFRDGKNGTCAGPDIEADITQAMQMIAALRTFVMENLPVEQKSVLKATQDSFDRLIDERNKLAHKYKEAIGRIERIAGIVKEK